ncbi:hypothetical protein B0H11DRAFT_1920232 [Mycena galericulata]|nr:hypothetical protein B0H11DRAFT_1920232 [Mycena galericulata]
MSARDTRFPNQALPAPHMAPYEVLHSGSWWKDYHANRARRRAHALAHTEPEPVVIDLAPQPPPFTFTPGPAAPITTATHGLPPCKTMERIRRERNIPVRDPDAELLARLTSRARSSRAEEKKAASQKRVLKPGTSRAKVQAAGGMGTAPRVKGSKKIDSK